MVLCGACGVAQAARAVAFSRVRVACALVGRNVRLWRAQSARGRRHGGGVGGVHLHTSLKVIS